MQTLREVLLTPTHRGVQLVRCETGDDSRALALPIGAAVRSGRSSDDDDASLLLPSQIHVRGRVDYHTTLWVAHTFVFDAACADARVLYSVPRTRMAAPPCYTPGTLYPPHAVVQHHDTVYENSSSCDVHAAPGQTVAWVRWGSVEELTQRVPPPLSCTRALAFVGSACRSDGADADMAPAAATATPRTPGSAAAIDCALVHDHDEEGYCCRVGDVPAHTTVHVLWELRGLTTHGHVAILAPANPKTAQAILSLGHKIEARLSEPYDLGDYTCKGSGSVGLLICDDPELAAHDLMERADHALYFAKRALQGRAVLFNAALEREMTTSSQVDKALRKADYDREFSVVFQPQYDLLKSRITGFEALARWDSPELGRVTPDVFIPAAERAGLIRPLTRTLLSKALDTMLDWPDETSLSFNLSTHDLMSPNAIEAILTTVRDSGIPAKRIEFEITETAMMSDFNQARRAIDQINRAGHSVALDDFGIGYSSLQYLQQLPVSKLKIDHSFVSSILEDTSSYKIVRTLLSLSRTLDLGCVIEGVETEAQLHILRTMGARHIQGYLIGQPMPADQVAPALTQKFDFSPRPMPQPRKAAQS